MFNELLNEVLSCDHVNCQDTLSFMPRSPISEIYMQSDYSCWWTLSVILFSTQYGSVNCSHVICLMSSSCFDMWNLTLLIGSTAVIEAGGHKEKDGVCQSITHETDMLNYLFECVVCLYKQPLEMLNLFYETKMYLHFLSFLKLTWGREFKFFIMEVKGPSVLCCLYHGC